MTKSRSQKETRIISYEEEAKIVALLRSTEANQRKSYLKDVADLIEVMADTGLRQMEALDLLYRDIELTTNVIHVRQTKSSPRRVPMTSRVATILMRRQEANKDKPFKLSAMQIRIAWTWAKEQLGINNADRFVLHSLRKTCAQRLFDAGVYVGIIDESKLVLVNASAIAIYDGYPVSSGHCLIIPKRHIASFFEATREEITALLDLLAEMQEILIKEFNPDGFNIGINVGEAAGQTVMHLHIHLIPRYAGDQPDPRGGVRCIFPDKAAYWNHQ